MKNIKILQLNKVCKNFYVVLFLLNTLAWKIHGQRSLVGCSPWGC